MVRVSCRNTGSWTVNSDSTSCNSPELTWSFVSNILNSRWSAEKTATEQVKLLNLAYIYILILEYSDQFGVVVFFFFQETKIITVMLGDITTEELLRIEGIIRWQSTNMLLSDGVTPPPPLPVTSPLQDPLTLRGDAPPPPCLSARHSLPWTQRTSKRSGIITSVRSVGLGPRLLRRWASTLRGGDTGWGL